MLQYLRHKRAPISRCMLALLGVIWLGLVMQTCAMAEARADKADCCCEESTPNCCRAYAPLPETPCPDMHAATADRQFQGLTVAENTPADPASAPERIVYPPVDTGFTSIRRAGSDTPRSHPALRFRVLLI